jgi:hypothetical protein
MDGPHHDLASLTNDDLRICAHGPRRSRLSNRDPMPRGDTKSRRSVPRCGAGAQAIRIATCGRERRDVLSSCLSGAARRAIPGHAGPALPGGCQGRVGAVQAPMLRERSHRSRIMEHGMISERMIRGLRVDLRSRLTLRRQSRSGRYRPPGCDPENGPNEPDLKNGWDEMADDGLTG